METRPAQTATSDRDSFILCRNSQGLEIRASVLRLTRFSVVFEVYNPYSILQLSEVLSDFQILINDTRVYSGRAVVSNILNAGIMLVCEVTLGDFWIDVDHLSSVNRREMLRSDFDEFIQEWQKIQRVIPEFKVAVADMQTLLLDLRRWLEQVEFGIRAEPSANRQELEREVIGDLEAPMLPLVMSWFARFDEVADQVDEANRAAHRAFARRLLHPLVLCSPFVYRTYHKPLGYAGDYEMVNMILREPYEGGSLFAKIVNVCFLKNPPAEAHRNRIDYLVNRLLAESRRALAKRSRLRIFNLGCGPAMEIRRFLKQHPESDCLDGVLMDFNDETLEHSEASMQAMLKETGRTANLRFAKRSVHQILKESSKSAGELAPGQYDFVYCAGLFDYMSDRICKRLMNIFYDLLAPGGLLVATNVDASRPFRHSMEFILEWHLICRDGAQMEHLAPERAPAGLHKVTSDPTTVNVFIEVRKPEKA